MKKILLSIFILSIWSGLKAQDGYHIDFKITGLADTTVYLGNFFGESTYVKDTATVNRHGEFSFSGQSRLDEGIYFLVLNKTRLFDIMISDDQHFKVETIHPEYIANTTIAGDKENDLFFKNLRFNRERNQEATPYVATLKDSTSTEAAKTSARQKLEKINKKVVAHQELIIDKHPGSFLAKVLKAKKRVVIPDPPRLPGGGIDSTFKLRYYKAHYWDNFDLADPALIRLAEPLYRKKVDGYLDNLFAQHPDTLTHTLKKLVDVAKKNKDTYKYLVWTLTLKYQNHPLMGLDEVFVNIYDEYFANGEMDFWANGQLKKNLKDRADQLRLSLIGMKAPNLIMLDEKLSASALHDLENKYAIIYFYDPDCGHCKKETPKLKKYVEESSFDLGIYAVSADTSMAKMKNYIQTMGLEQWVTVNGPRTYTEHYQKLYDAFTTPTIYVLDEQKKIIAKKIAAENLHDFLTNYEKHQEKSRH